ncbi:MAG: hypothetical protein J0L75_17500 [Spirochaetes bacterium]|nr:hypothetical protein [Spirochaetota bacterium]
MLKMSIPLDGTGSALCVKKIFSECVRTFRDKDLVTRLESVINVIHEFSINYANFAATVDLHKVLRSVLVGNLVTSKEMEEVYTNKFVPEKSPGRPYYNIILNSAPASLCPLCAVGIATTLDHHLPKTKYPELSIAPLNLVPSCVDCQTNKKSKYPRKKEDQTFHPYFDNFESETWLKADLIQTSPVSFRYFVDAPPNWSSVQIERARNHIEVFRLCRLYAINAGQEACVIRKALVDLYYSGGAGLVRDHLKRQARSCGGIAKNSWRTAMYSALHLSDWFCSGGFDGHR